MFDFLFQYTLVEWFGLDNPVQITGYVLLFGVFIVGMLSKKKTKKE